MRGGPQQLRMVHGARRALPSEKHTPSNHSPPRMGALGVQQVLSGARTCSRWQVEERRSPGAPHPHCLKELFGLRAPGSRGKSELQWLPAEWL